MRSANHRLRIMIIPFLFFALFFLVLPIFAVQAQTLPVPHPQSVPPGGVSSSDLNVLGINEQLDNFNSQIDSYQERFGNKNFQLTQDRYNTYNKDLVEMRQTLDKYYSSTTNESLKTDIRAAQSRVDTTGRQLDSLRDTAGIPKLPTAETAASADKKSELPGKDLTARDVYCIMVRLMNWTFTIAVILAIIMMIVVGVRYVTASSGGKVDAVGEATKNLKYVFLGIVIIFLAWSLVRGTAVIISVGAPEFPTCPSSQLVPSDTTKIQDVFPK